MTNEHRPSTLLDIAGKWLPLGVIVVGGISSFSYAMAQQVQTAERVNKVEIRQDVLEPEVRNLSGDIREIKTDVRWLREYITSKK
jgi:hypothetical protein